MTGILKFVMANEAELSLAQGMFSERATLEGTHGLNFKEQRWVVVYQARQKEVW